MVEKRLRYLGRRKKGHPRDREAFAGSALYSKDVAVGDSGGGADGEIHP